MKPTTIALIALSAFSSANCYQLTQRTYAEGRGAGRADVCGQLGGQMRGAVCILEAEPCVKQEK